MADRRARILGAALEEFAAKGFKGATIKSIARAAGLQSPALIYHYFPDKKALLWETLEAHAPVVRAVSEPDRLMGRAPEEVLPLLGRAYLELGEANGDLLRLVVGEALRDPEMNATFAEGGPLRVLGVLEEYLRRQVEAGRLRPHDVRSGARAFVGMLIPQLIGRVLVPRLGEEGPTNEEHLEAMVGIFLRGLEPER